MVFSPWTMTSVTLSSKKNVLDETKYAELVSVLETEETSLR
jgi:hypothetical protein